MLGHKRTSPDAQRRAELSKIHCGKRDLHLDDETYREIVKRVTGKVSSADLDARERGLLLDEFRRLGQRSPKTLNNEGGSAGPQRRLIESLWFDIGQLGALTDRSEKALRHFVKNQTGADALEWLMPEDANTVIEILKIWRKREYARADAVNK